MLKLRAGDDFHLEEEERLQSLGQCVIMLTRFWQLQRCELEGDFNIVTAVQLLPDSLQHLVLSPQHAPPPECTTVHL